MRQLKKRPEKLKLVKKNEKLDDRNRNGFDKQN